MVIIVSHTRQSYNRQAARYEKRWKAYLDHTHKEFLKRIEVREGNRVLDVSCGTGLLAEELIKRDAPFGELVLNDISEEMIAIARERVGEHPNIHFTDYPADQFPEPAQPFNLILCLNAFHHYENQKQVVDLFHKHLKLGGRVCILDWNRIGLFRPVNKFIDWITPEHIETRSDREMKALLAQAGFAITSMDIWPFRYWRFFYIQATKEE